MNIRPLFAAALRVIATTVHAQVPLGTASSCCPPSLRPRLGRDATRLRLRAAQSGGSARHRLGSERSYTSRSAR